MTETADPLQEAAQRKRFTVLSLCFITALRLSALRLYGVKVGPTYDGYFFVESEKRKDWTVNI